MSGANAPSQGILQGHAAFAQTDMMSLEHIDNPPPKLSATDGNGNSVPLHPLMQKAHDDFHTRYQRFALEQPIRLASRILMSGVLHPFFQTFTALPTTWTSGNATGLQYTGSRMSYDRPISAHDRSIVDGLLNSLAENVSFHIHRPGDPDDETHYTSFTQHPITAFAGPLPVPPSHTLPILHGRKSEIYINGTAIDNLFSAYSDANTNHVRTYLLSFELAVALLHELTHAFRNFMILTYSPHQPYLGPRSLVAEIGFELEKYLFGGYVANLEHEFRAYNVYSCQGEVVSPYQPLCIFEWPSCSLIRTYATFPNLDFSMRGRLRPIRPLDNAWRVSILDDLRPLFDDSEWAPGGKFVPAVGYPSRTRFLFPRRKGYTLRPSIRVPGRVKPVKIIQNAREDQKYVPVGYERLANGDIRPKRGRSAEGSPWYNANVGLARTAFR